jgi:hypothetical protein
MYQGIQHPTNRARPAGGPVKPSRHLPHTNSPLAGLGLLCRYVWHLGNVYDGEWRAGKMHGQGTLRWRTGE